MAAVSQPRLTGTYNYTGTVVTQVVNGEVNRHTVLSSGRSGAVSSFLSHPKGLFKTLATVLSVVKIWSDSTAVVAAESGFNGAGSLCGALPDAIGEGFKAAKGFSKKDGHKEVKTWASLFKSTSDFSALPGIMDKMKVVKLSGDTLYGLTLFKNIFTLVGDALTLFIEFVKKPAEIKSHENAIKAELLVAEKQEALSAKAKAVTGVVFHALLAVAAIFLYPVSPILITGLAVVYTVAVTVNHFVAANKKDVEAKLHQEYLAID
ncbi:MAG: hypothetical protein FJZ59_00500 [Chlamydiae bacterium]|nr:hypothetical protein [Chlamydiota bacterium]